MKATDARESDDLGGVRRLAFGESTCRGIANRRVDPLVVENQIPMRRAIGKLPEPDRKVVELAGSLPVNRKVTVSVISM